MAGIIKGSINLMAIPSDKIITGKKGKYIPVTITVNDEQDQFGNFGPIIVEQTNEEETLEILKNIKKTIANIEEVKARKAMVIAILDSKNKHVSKMVDHSIVIPQIKNDF